ncbi:dolichol-phosphate mannosyltransferase subunit 3 [Orussus abietinus]|uniref:dolichol-phosphate mannosyltransferase subunit 3 n=1 Tax=Orussus abietinus TaxID=222816 RepID=UPI000626BE57|nr:dolichol-phosphate mannosyltransferase subunit 3 [Orussus abietinus]
MTKLMEWLFVATFFLAIWIAALTGKVHPSLADDYHHIVQVFPALVILSLGLYAAIVVLYRTFTFNTCESAAKELQQQIKEAKMDLKSKGFVFNDD